MLKMVREIFFSLFFRIRFKSFFGDDFQSQVFQRKADQQFGTEGGYSQVSFTDLPNKKVTETTTLLGHLGHVTMVMYLYTAHIT